MTVRTEITFAVKESASGTPWLAFEGAALRGEGLPSGLYGFDLKPGTSHEQAQAVADFLNDNVAKLNFTAMPLA